MANGRQKRKSSVSKSKLSFEPGRRTPSKAKNKATVGTIDSAVHSQVCKKPLPSRLIPDLDAKLFVFHGGWAQESMGSALVQKRAVSFISESEKTPP